MIHEGLTNTAFVQDDGQGNRSLFIPGVGAIGTALQSLGDRYLPTMVACPSRSRAT